MPIQSLIFVMSVTFAVIVLFDVLPPRGVRQITVIKLREMMKDDTQSDIQYIDVRPATRFIRLHVFGFKNIPLDELKKEVGELAKDRKIVVMSERGYYGNKACKLLKRKGFSKLANVRGGMVTWEPHGEGFYRND